MGRPIIHSLDELLPFWWGSWAAAGFAIFGAVAGAERMMDAFEGAMRVLRKVAKHVHRS